MPLTIDYDTAECVDPSDECRACHGSGRVLTPGAQRIATRLEAWAREHMDVDCDDITIGDRIELRRWQPHGGIVASVIEVVRSPDRRHPYDEITLALPGGRTVAYVVTAKTDVTLRTWRRAWDDDSLARAFAYAREGKRTRSARLVQAEAA